MSEIQQLTAEGKEVVEITIDGIPFVGAGVDVDDFDFIDEPMIELYKSRELFTSIRQDFDYIDDILQDEEKANELTADAMCAYYIAEYDENNPGNDEWISRFLDTGVMTFVAKHLFLAEANDIQESLLLTEWLDRIGVGNDDFPLFYIMPDIFYDGLINMKEPANIIFQSSIICDLVAELEENYEDDLFETFKAEDYFNEQILTN